LKIPKSDDQGHEARNPNCHAGIQEVSHKLRSPHCDLLKDGEHFTA
jgi:hypothetical protein